MQSKTSLVNKEVVKSILRSVGWVSILYFLLLFLIIPLNLFIHQSNEQREYILYENLFEYSFFLQAALMIGVPVILSMFLFRFLQVRQYSDFIHSLPVTRNRIFHQYTLLGYLLLVIPIIFIAILILLFYTPLELNELFSISEIFRWLGLTVLFNSIFYISGVAVGMVAGISVVQGVLTYIALLLPFGLLMLISYNLQFFLFGFSAEFILQNKLDYISPLIVSTQIFDLPVTVPQLILYISLVIILYFTGLFLYKRRRVEAVSHALVFPILKPIFKYGVTFCVMLVGGLYFGELQGTLSWMIVGYIFGAILGYLLAEMVLQKSWRITVHLKGFAVYSGVMILIVLIFKFDVFFYEKRIPNYDDIASVHFSDGYFAYNQSVDKEPFFLKDEDNIDLVRQLHKSIIANKGKENIKSYETEHAFFVYQLKNGQKIVREYPINRSNYVGLYKLIQESEEYKTGVNEIFHVNVKKIPRIEISSGGPLDKRILINDQDEISQVIDLIKKDIKSATYEDNQDTSDPYAYLNIYLNKNEAMNLEWKYYHQNLSEWIEAHDYDRVRVSADDIDYAMVIRNSDLNIDNFDELTYEEIVDKMDKTGRGLKLSDAEDIKQSLKKTAYYGETEYTIAYIFKQTNQVEIKGITEKDASERIKEYFQ
ncbi:DUF6449 domain-containing protein [Cytobacillus purgationiresistens]|uniref:ABC-2 type transport system permease protein n=1 Tax=Cytobacillus purgationiresistens TaxID=863449 RepID=A0ABU0AM16_9BACI|nr:DUF6449 domain-containing protein [Cytobacillus purgationiresistens]MDQ0272309.1 ABC-2 type transport system permease protein [Cytobacillus purgationiresistens]